jgi:hypothetical protein
MGRKKKPGGPLKGGGYSAKANGLVGILFYVTPEEREEHRRAAKLIKATSVRDYAAATVRNRTKRILGKTD